MEVRSWTVKSGRCNHSIHATGREFSSCLAKRTEVSTADRREMAYWSSVAVGERGDEGQSHLLCFSAWVTCHLVWHKFKPGWCPRPLQNRWQVFRLGEELPIWDLWGRNPMHPKEETAAIYVEYFGSSADFRFWLGPSAQWSSLALRRCWQRLPFPSFYHSLAFLTVNKISSATEAWS